MIIMNEFYAHWAQQHAVQQERERRSRWKPKQTHTQCTTEKLVIVVYAMHTHYMHCNRMENFLKASATANKQTNKQTRKHWIIIFLWLKYHFYYIHRVKCVSCTFKMDLYCQRKKNVSKIQAQYNMYIWQKEKKNEKERERERKMFSSMPKPNQLTQAIFVALHSSSHNQFCGCISLWWRTMASRNKKIHIMCITITLLCRITYDNKMTVRKQSAREIADIKKM